MQTYSDTALSAGAVVLIFQGTYNLIARITHLKGIHRGSRLHGGSAGRKPHYARYDMEALVIDNSRGVVGYLICWTVNDIV